MRPGRELDCKIATDVFGRNVFVKKRVLHETTEHGDRPLRQYSKEMSDAWEVVEKMAISILPIEDGQWFALVGNKAGWKSPAEFIQYLSTGNFLHAGAGVAESAPLAICIAAIQALEHRKQSQGATAQAQPAQALLN